MKHNLLLRLSTLLRLGTLVLLGAAALSASGVTFSAIPLSGQISGLPGETIGWGFDIASDNDDWIAITSSIWLFESNPTIGFYTDSIGLQGGPQAGYLQPLSPNWLQFFDNSLNTVLGSFTIDNAAPLGGSTTATLRILFERYSDDPTVCTSCFLSGDSADLQLTVNVAEPSAAIPEPGTYTLFATALAILWARKKLQQRESH
jgi:hypothetical protein